MDFFMNKNEQNMNKCEQNMNKSAHGFKWALHGFLWGKIPKHEYKNYLEKRKYNLLSVTDYINLLKKKGFSLVSGEDKTLLFINILKQEIQNLKKSNLKLNEKNEIRLSWLKKLARAELGEQCWGWFYATKNVKS